MNEYPKIIASFRQKFFAPDGTLPPSLLNRWESMEEGVNC
jgi:hypothetical protein